MPRRIFYGAADEPALRRELYGFGRGRGIVTEAFLEVRGHGQRGGATDDARLCHRFVDGHVAIKPAQGAGRRSTRGGKRREAQRGEDARRSAIPTVGDDE